MTSPDDSMLATLRRIGTIAPEVIELFDYLEDTSLWMKDEAGHYEWVNVSFLLNFGVKTRAEIIGRTDYDFCSEVLANQYRIDDERVLRGERILSRVELVGRFDHTARWCFPASRSRRSPPSSASRTRAISRRSFGNSWPRRPGPTARAISSGSPHSADRGLRPQPKEGRLPNRPNTIGRRFFGGWETTPQADKPPLLGGTIGIVANVIEVDQYQRTAVRDRTHLRRAGQRNRETAGRK